MESDREFKICASEKLFVVRNSLNSYSFKTSSEGREGRDGEPESERRRSRRQAHHAVMQEVLSSEELRNLDGM